jgi:Fur family ferric uptake transcriptional regulator
MADDGRVDVLRSDAGEAVYRRCAEIDHHHHLVCRSCGAAVEVSRPAVERWAAEVASAHGYVDVTHTVEIFGLCPRCASGG